MEKKNMSSFSNSAVMDWTPETEFRLRVNCGHGRQASTIEISDVKIRVATRVATNGSAVTYAD